jgi:tripartite-type tricarboxylate transporter receptor subunit TctC
MFIAPPGIDKNRIAMFNAAALKLEKDEEFLDEAKKLNIFINFIHKKEVDEIMSSLIRTDSKILSYVSGQ